MMLTEGFLNLILIFAFQHEGENDSGNDRDDADDHDDCAHGGNRVIRGKVGYGASDLISVFIVNNGAVGEGA